MWRWAAPAILLLAQPLLAQQAIGVVRDSAGHPIAGAIVELRAEGRTIARALATDAGRYRITAPRGGAYRIRVLRIGFRSLTDSISIPAAGQLDRDLFASPVPVRLAAVVVRADRRCLVRPDDGRQAAALWEEARKALHAAEIVASAGYRATARQFERQRTRSGNVTFDSVWIESRTIHRSTFSALPASSLADSGFVRLLPADTIAYYAPDAEVLVDDAFLDTHCFGIDESKRTEGLIGLRFEPVAGTRQPDVEGTLWLDLESSELRWLDYHYTRLPAEVPRESAGGHVAYRRLPSGAWIVESWWIRMPVYSTTVHQRRDPVPFGPARVTRERRTRAVVAFRERGAEVIEIEAQGRN